MKALTISVISALFIAALHAEPRTFYLNVPADMAGHAFGLYQYDPNDPNSTFSSAYFVPSYWDVSTGTLSLSAVVEDENRSVFVDNYTIGGEISADGVWTSGSISATSFDFTSGGYNVFTFSNDAAYKSNVYGLLFDTTASNGGIWAFPATGQTGEVSLPIPDAGNPTNTGIFNLWFDTGISRNSYYGSATLVDLTRWMYLDGAGTWRWLGSYQVPTMEVIIDVGVDSEGQSFTLHTQGGSAQALVAAFDGGISGQVGMFEEFWVTRDADGALSPRATAMTGIPTQGWSSSFAVQPPNWVQTPFFIGQEIAGHPIKAVHPDGREQWLEPDPAIPWPDNVSTTIGNVTHSYQIFHFRATVDSS